MRLILTVFILSLGFTCSAASIRARATCGFKEGHPCNAHTNPFTSCCGGGQGQAPEYQTCEDNVTKLGSCEPRRCYNDLLYQDRIQCKLGRRNKSPCCSPSL